MDHWNAAKSTFEKMGRSVNQTAGAVWQPRRSRLECFVDPVNSCLEALGGPGADSW